MTKKKKNIKKNSLKIKKVKSVKKIKKVKKVKKIKKVKKAKKIKKIKKVKKVKRFKKSKKVKQSKKIKKVKRFKKFKKVKQPKKIKKVKRFKKSKKIKKTKKIKNIKRDSIKKKIIDSLNIKNVLFNFFKPILDKYSNYFEDRKRAKLKKIEEERKIKLFQIEKERKEKDKKIKEEEKLRIYIKEKALKEEIKIAKDRDRDIKSFLRKEQAEIRREQAERQKKFLAELKIEKQIEKFQVREIKELENLEKISLKEKREDYAGLQLRIEKLKEKYRAIRDEKIRERVEALGVKIQEGDDREALLKKEKEYRIERQKIENCLESFYRSSASLCFQINKRYIPKHKSILRCIDRRFENGEIFIKWDDSPQEDWLLLIYIKNNLPKDGVVIEDKSNPEKNISHEFKTNEIFKASDVMVDSLTQLLERERSKKTN
tara:strand:- start:4984 stop:6273 length:1290 start_codon:yes stop_codon:yes gene_type:complete